jgi:hypothetical protein
MVIDGRVQLVGNNLDDVRQKIAGEAKQPKPAQVSLKWSGSDQLHVAVLVQDPATARVLGAGEIAYPTSEKAGRKLLHRPRCNFSGGCDSHPWRQSTTTKLEGEKS